MAEEQLHGRNGILLQSVYNFMTRLKAHGVGFSTYTLETPWVCCMLRATPLASLRGKVSCSLVCFDKGSVTSQCVYKMLTTVSLSMTPDPVTSQSSGDTVPVSSVRLHVESHPDLVTGSTAQPKAICQPESAIHLPPSGCPLYFNLMQFSFLFFTFFTQLGVFSLERILVCFTEKGILHRIYICIYFWNMSQE